MVICGPGPNLLTRAARLGAIRWFSRSGSVRSFAHSGRRLLTHPRHRRWDCATAGNSCGGHPCRIPIVLILCQHGPNRPRHPVRQRDCDKHPRFPCRQAGEPGSVGYGLTPEPGQTRHCSHDQKSANVGLSGLRHPSQPILAARRMLARNEPEPSREIPTAPEAGHRRGERFDRQRGQWSDARHRLQPASHSGYFRH